MHTAIHLFLIALTWSVYFGLHSWLASHACKNWVAQRLPRLMPVYRLTYNLLALIFLIPPGVLTLIYPGPPIWRWVGPLAWLADGLALAAVAGFPWSLLYYDGPGFLGLRQWRSGSTEVDIPEPFVISPLHRYVRHPWYFFMLVILWTRDMTAGGVLFAVAATVYLVIGSRREEDQLIARYGDAYRRYQSQVPPLLPMHGRVLSKVAARELLEGKN